MASALTLDALPLNVLLQFAAMLPAHDLILGIGRACKLLYAVCQDAGVWAAIVAEPCCVEELKHWAVKHPSITHIDLDHFVTPPDGSVLCRFPNLQIYAIAYGTSCTLGRDHGLPLTYSYDVDTALGAAATLTYLKLDEPVDEMLFNNIAVQCTRITYLECVEPPMCVATAFPSLTDYVCFTSASHDFSTAFANSHPHLRTLCIVDVESTAVPTFPELTSLLYIGTTDSYTEALVSSAPGLTCLNIQNLTPGLVDALCLRQPIVDLGISELDWVDDAMECGFGARADSWKLKEYTGPMLPSLDAFNSITYLDGEVVCDSAFIELGPRLNGLRKLFIGNSHELTSVGAAVVVEHAKRLSYLVITAALNVEARKTLSAACGNVRTLFMHFSCEEVSAAVGGNGRVLEASFGGGLPASIGAFVSAYPGGRLVSLRIRSYRGGSNAKQLEAFVAKGGSAYIYGGVDDVPVTVCALSHGD